MDVGTIVKFLFDAGMVGVFVYFALKISKAAQDERVTRDEQWRKFLEDQASDSTIHWASLLESERTQRLESRERNLETIREQTEAIREQTKLLDEMTRTLCAHNIESKQRNDRLVDLMQECFGK